MEHERSELLECAHKEERDLIEHVLIVFVIGLGAIASIPALGSFVSAVFSYMVFQPPGTP